jgi:PAS domain S-box-containing protein
VSPAPAAVNLLLVDDREENLVALRAILEPLGEHMVSARSGEEALRALLHQDFACILLDVQMPGLDGFDTAELIKQRERSKSIPIIFLTAISKEDRHVFRGYSSGAVDYLFKPFDPEVLRSKVAVFVDLHRKTAEVKRQAELLREHDVAEERKVSEDRYRQLADAMPQIVWAADRAGRATYYNRRWYEYTGQSVEDAGEAGWKLAVHPDDLPAAVARREVTLASGEVFEAEYRFRAADGTYRWHLGRAVPISGAGGTVDFWIGTATDIHDQKRTQQAQRFLLEAGELLGTSLHYVDTLEAVARAAVPAVADWAAVHVVYDGEVRQVALAHVDPQKIVFAEELQVRYPPDEQSAVAEVVRTGKSQLVGELTDATLRQGASDELHYDLIRELGLESYVCVPLTVQDRVLGAITLATAESGRRYDETDLRFAEELGRRAATAIENARLYQEADERAQASRVLQSVADGVVLVDREGIVRLWNPAAARITGLAIDDVVGRPIVEVVPGWQELALRIPVADDPGTGRAETTPVELDGRELWISGSGVELDEGIVYAFRDLTEERALEQMRSDFVATVSHELRTPLAAIYGAALTIRRPDLELDEELHDHLLRVIAEESDRLASIVEDLLIASHLDSGKLRLAFADCDPADLVAGVVEAAVLHVPGNVRLVVDVAPELPRVRADPSQLRQVIGNLVDNAVKYSPDGGEVRVSAAATNGGSVRFSVSDSGLGIPAGEQRRIFEKFYRLDPNMTRGIGGTGLGLYISSELVRRFDGRIWVDSEEGEGSTFHVELPTASKSRRNRPALAT